MSFAAAQLCTLVAACEQFRGAKAPAGYPTSLALCVVDSVQSVGVTYASVENVVARYRAFRREQDGDPDRDGVPELLATFDELGGPGGWAEQIGNRNRTSSRGGVLKAAAIQEAARMLAAEAVATTADLRTAVQDGAREQHLSRAWRAVHGQRSGVTWHYVQMLAGIPGVKPDRMIIRFVADSLGLPRAKVATGFAAEILTATAAELHIPATDLDHAVWQWQRRRK